MSIKHIVDATIYGTVELYNDDDGFYRQEFTSREEVEQFISELRNGMNEVWPEGVDEKEVVEKGRLLREEHIREREEEYRKNNPPLTKEEIKRRNQELIASGISNVACNFHTPLETLEKLAMDNSYFISTKKPIYKGFG